MTIKIVTLTTCIFDNITPLFYEQTSEINRSWIILHSLIFSCGLQNLMDQRRRTIEEWILRRTEAWRFQEDLLVSNCEWSSHRTLPKTSYYKYYCLIFYKIEAYSNIYKKIIWLHINISYTKNRYIQEKQNIHVSLKMYIKSETIANKMKTNLLQFILQWILFDFKYG